MKSTPAAAQPTKNSRFSSLSESSSNPFLRNIRHRNEQDVFKPFQRADSFDSDSDVPGAHAAEASSSAYVPPSKAIRLRKVEAGRKQLKQQNQEPTVNAFRPANVTHRQGHASQKQLGSLKDDQAFPTLGGNRNAASGIVAGTVWSKGEDLAAMLENNQLSRDESEDGGILKPGWARLSADGVEYGERSLRTLHRPAANWHRARLEFQRLKQAVKDQVAADYENDATMPGYDPEFVAYILDPEHVDDNMSSGDSEGNSEEEGDSVEGGHDDWY